MSTGINIVVYGATSTIAQALMKVLVADQQSNWFLIARNQKRLEAVKADLEARGAQQVHLAEADLADFSQHESLWQRANECLGTINKVILCHGTLGNQSLSEKDFHTASSEINLNFLSYVSILTPIANQMETDGTGQIVVISSVAGNRGRQSNYIYGSSKAALTSLTSGLRNRLFKSGVHVLTVLPGFVDTAMTQHLNKNFLFASPEKVAHDIAEAMKKRKDVIYTPKFWRLIMLIFSTLPEFIFKRLKL